MTDDVDLEQVLADAYPTCELCGSDLEPTGDDERPYWRCPSCGVALIAQ